MSQAKTVAKRPVKRPLGRPTDFKAEYIDLAFKYALLGAKDSELARNFDCSESTLNLWKLEHPAFSESINRGKQEADAKVAHSLYHRATGYDHDDIDIRTVSVGEGCSKIVQTPYIKHIPPDVTAQIFWLKNRRPDSFRDKPEVSVTVCNEVTLGGTPPEELTVEQLEANVAKMRMRPLAERNG